MYTEYSVLMSVYKNETPDFLRKSIESMIRQTKLTNDFVLICDGPLTNELDQVVNFYHAKYSNLFRVFRIDKNVGLGCALNYGISKCKNELVARMDSDDISLNFRCEKQLKIFNTQNVDIVSGTVDEFESLENNIIGRRILPRQNNDIVEFAKFRCPFNHPCVMFKKSKVLRSGGYQHLFRLEDYYLWVRMILNGCVGYNIPETILLMRGGIDMYKRRSGFKYLSNQIRLIQFMKTNKMLNSFDYLKALSLRIMAQLCPVGLKKIIYKQCFR